MKSVWARTLCRLLMVLMVWSPMQFAQAGMIGTDQVASVASQHDRDTVLQFLGRADVATQLQSLGVDPASVTDLSYFEITANASTTAVVCADGRRVRVMP